MNSEPFDQHLKVLRALSSLFLDTEITDDLILRISDCLMESGYTYDEIEDVMINEVYPACRFNFFLWQWQYFSDGFIEGNIMPRKNARNSLRNKIRLFLFKRSWVYADWKRLAASLKRRGIAFDKKL